MAPTLTIDRAIQIQINDLIKWKSVLKPEIYDKVEKIVKRKNIGITNPNDIYRGSDIDNIVKNISNGNEYMYDEYFTFNVAVYLTIKSKKTESEIETAIRKGIFRGLDSEPNYVAQPKDVDITEIIVKS